MNHWDVIVVGAGQAGCAAAWDLAAGGGRVLLLHTGPARAKPCAGGLTIKALQRYRFPVDAVIRERIDQLALSRAGRQQGMVKAPTGASFCVMTHRPELDELCRQQARERGADWWHSAGVRRLHQDHQGLGLTTLEGDVLSADYLVAADGAHSPVRRLLHGDTRVPGALALEGHLPRERASIHPPMTLDFQEVAGGYGWLFPKGDHVNLGLYVWQRGRAKPTRALLADYARRSLGSDQLESLGGYPLGTWLHKRPVACGRVLFAGDAAGATEPLLGEGIYGALLTGQAAAAALLAGCPGDYPQLVTTWREEVRQVARLTRLFYGLLPVSYPLLRHGFAPTLLKGYAEGLTLGQTLRRWRRIRPFARGPAC